MYAYQGNLLDPNDPDPREFSGFDFHLFDIAVVGLGFHHFDDPALAAQRLVERLRPGGVLLILDFLPHGKVADVRLFSSTSLGLSSKLELQTRIQNGLFQVR